MPNRDVPPRFLGRQLTADLYACEPASLREPGTVEAAMLEAARACGATIVGSHFHAFNPHGVSGVVIIAESHLAIHTWPEYGYAAIDAFTCGESLDPTLAIQRLAEAFGAEPPVLQWLERGDHARLPAPRA